MSIWLIVDPTEFSTFEIIVGVTTKPIRAVKMFKKELRVYVVEQSQQAELL